GIWPALGRLAQARGADVVHIQYQAAAYALHPAINLLPWWLRLTRPRLRTVVTFHDLRVPYLFPKAGPLRWGSILALAVGCHGAILTNVEDDDRLARYGGRIQRFRIPIGVNIPRLSDPTFHREAQRARWGVAPETLLLCHFGFLNESKGFEDLVDALALIQTQDHAHPLRLLVIGGVAGSSDPTNVRFIERIRQRIADRGLEHLIAWTGYVSEEEASANLLCSDLAVLPYRDGASFRRGTLLVALTHGLPTVTTTPAVRTPELRHGENVWLAPARQPTALAEAIAQLAAQPQLRARLGAQANQLGVLFRWETIAQRTQEAYREVLAR
ncbi:MAG: glycosyltransferase family 4 protein, partial [Chloroflexi bacterium]|nr:glycosyltransferase family 4 protein [Chloroflexota bacterium]